LAQDAMKPWASFVARTRLMKPHQLSDELERYTHDFAIVGGNAWVQLFDETMATLSFDIDGKTLSNAEVFNLLADPDRETRAKAAAAITETLGDNQRLLTRINNTVIKQKEIDDRWRGYERPVSSRNVANEVEDEVVQALADTVTEAFPRISHRYYAMKAKWLGLDKLEPWDRNAPLPEADEAKIPWLDAKARVLDAYAGFTPAMAEIAGDFFDKGWIDTPVIPGKDAGAFAHPCVPSAHPYVLVNYQGKTRDVMTLAHELGHGVHQVLAARQGYFNGSTPLTLAETASVFGEMLTFQSLLADASDKTQRKILLAGKVEDMLNTVVRQIAFHNFETRVHAARQEKELLREDFRQHWMETQIEALGPAFNLEQSVYGDYWSYIPHFIHVPFYVYAYAFGDCLVNSLYAVYQNSGDDFAGKYLDMLGAGGTLRHHELLAPFGLDAREPSFWRQGLGLLESFIDELETL
ncbi:MAG: M3 family oligoendopeptidase, partial [Pseudomonadota bacterium]|nr:M3 family oligoendopeptidase [Pseudomonadota bacterium]